MGYTLFLPRYIFKCGLYVSKAMFLVITDKLMPNLATLVWKQTVKLQLLSLDVVQKEIVPAWNFTWNHELAFIYSQDGIVCYGVSVSRFHHHDSPATV